MSKPAGEANYGPTKPEILRNQADSYEAQARQAERDGLQVVPLGAVNTTVEQLRRWTQKMRAEANEIERQRAAAKSLKASQRREPKQ